MQYVTWEHVPLVQGPVQLCPNLVNPRWSWWYQNSWILEPLCLYQIYGMLVSESM